MLSKFIEVPLECESSIKDHEHDFEKFYFISMVSCILNLILLSLQDLISIFFFYNLAFLFSITILIFFYSCLLSLYHLHAFSSYLSFSTLTFFQTSSFR